MLILKDPAKLQLARDIFQGTAIKITTEGKRHLGDALGSEDFKTQYVSDKVAKWCEEIHQLAEIAKSQPQAAYAAFTHGEKHRFSYFMRTISGMRDLMQPLDDVINKELIPAILGTDTFSPADRELFSLPLRYGGLGMPVLSGIAEEEYLMSKRLTAPLTTIMIMQGNTIPDRSEVAEIKKTISANEDTLLKQKAALVQDTLPEATTKAMKQASTKGASSWLSVIPLAEHGFTLNKGEFRDALAIRYNKPLSDLPSHCPCGDRYDLNHALNCKRGGFVIMRHDNVRDFEANLLRKICNDVETEPRLQPLEGEGVNGLAGDDARPDIRARSAWRNAQNAFFDVCITNTDCASQRHLSDEQILRIHENDKKRSYNDRIMNIEHGTFTPLVYTVNGGAGPEAERLHKHLADKISQKTGDRYAQVMAMIRCKLSFIILRACLTCVRGSRKRNPADGDANVEDFAMACRDVRLMIE